MLHPEGYQVDATSEDSVGANEDVVYITGNWLPPEPEVGVKSWSFEITDIVNKDGISVLHQIEDEQWLLATEEYIANNFR